MDFKGLNTTWKATQSNNRFLITANLCLAMALLVAIVTLSQNKERLVIVPPHIPKGMELSWTAASPEYFKSVSAYLAGTIGGASVSNLEFTTQVLERFFVPSIKDELRIRLSRIAKDPLRTLSGATVWFEGRELLWEQQTEKAFVRGDLVTLQAGASSASKMDVTYEFKMKVENGMPLVVAFNSYSGEPRTQEWLNQADHLGIAEDRRKGEAQAEESRALEQSEDARRAEENR